MPSYGPAARIHTAGRGDLVLRLARPFQVRYGGRPALPQDPTGRSAGGITRLADMPTGRLWERTRHRRSRVAESGLERTGDLRERTERHLASRWK